MALQETECPRYRLPEKRRPDICIYVAQKASYALLRSPFLIPCLCPHASDQHRQTVPTSRPVHWMELLNRTISLERFTSLRFSPEISQAANGMVQLHSLASNGKTVDGVAASNRVSGKELADRTSRTL